MRRSSRCSAIWKAIAAAAGASLQDAVKVSVFLTDMGDFARVNEAMARHVPQPYPARAAVGVASASRAARWSRSRRCWRSSREAAEDFMAKVGNPREPLTDSGCVDAARARGRASAPRAGRATDRAKAVRDKLDKLGVRRQLDLVLHLPLRYEDETRLTRLADASGGETVQVECEVEHTSVQFRPKRTLVCRVRDGDEILHLRFFNFYPSQQKQLAPGTRVRLMGDAQGFLRRRDGPSALSRGYSGDRCREALTPVYPTTAGLAQALLRKLVEQALDAVELADTLPSELITRLKLPSIKQSIVYLHNPPTDVARSSCCRSARIRPGAG